MKQADLVFISGRVITIDERLPRASAVALEGDRILVVGDDAAVRETVGSHTQVVDLKGRALLPGFHDAHCHPDLFGRSLLQIDCRPQTVSRLEEIVAGVKAEASRLPAGQWIRGGGYDELQLPPNYAITRYDLDPVSADHPVCLSRACHHAITVNSRALALAGITRETPDPPGGQIDRDANGEPTGVLRETALDLVYNAIPLETAEETESAILRAGQKYLAAGITSVQDASVDAKGLGAYLRLHQKAALPLRVNMMVNPPVLDFLLEAELPTGTGDEWLRVGPLKIFMDGGIGARTAAQSQPYENEPDNRGILWMEREALDALVERAYRGGFQIATHAIGDRAIRMVLDAYRRVLAQWPRPDHRLRIEHCSMPLGDLVERVAELGVLVVTQPIFVAGALGTYTQNLGPERMDHVLPFRRFLDARIPLAGSSDSPVASYVPLEGIQAAVTPRASAGGGVSTQHVISLAEALRMFTLGGAYASFEESNKGSVTEGKLADLVVLDQDPFTVPAGELSSIAVELTVLGGKIAYQRPGSGS